MPGLAAKPIIDILVEVPDSAGESAYLPQLEEAGYELHVREPDWYEHRMFRTPEKDVHIHLYSVGCEEIERVLTFRDRLRRNSDDRSRYEQVKRELAVALNAFLEPIRTRREEFARDENLVWDVVQDGTARGRQRAAEVMDAVRGAMKIDYLKS